MQNYQIIKKIYESASSLVYQVVQKKDNQLFILKILKENYPTASELTRYKQEYTITRSLDSDSIIKAYELQRLDNTLTMVLEDFGGQSLKLLISQRQLNLEEFLQIAIKITVGLTAIHQANIIHKDINPSNIVYNPQTKQLKIIDFGISTQLAQEFVTACSPNQIEGTLAYIAPEQTGRMNRSVDYRSDFYSLGITFYELLTDQLPFSSPDPMELVHCHIAQVPKPIHELVPDCPVVVSHIIEKLLAKTPEERYQSAWGIQTDLETCLHQLQTNSEISIFPLGSQDFSEKFTIPQKLYGREQEVAQLLNAFERVSQGSRELFLISGYSGIGKTTLVNEIYKPITRQRGKFIKGKFDQLQRDIPYSAIIQAFQDLICQILSESENSLQLWGQRILESLGNNGQIVIDIIPDLEKIIGQQPLVEQLGKTESENRFNLFFKRFFNVFCQPDHPLIIFIDDLQWADLSSLDLIGQLISDSDIQYFLIIGTYRDNEVDPTHPLMYTLDKIKQAQVIFNKVNLYPLSIQQINQLIIDSFNCSLELSQPLAKLIGEKTGGNPFFLRQFLHYLYKEKLLILSSDKFSPSKKTDKKLKKHWQWNIDKIKKVSSTENIINLMITRIEKLDSQAKEVIKLAACIGNTFSLEILSSINQKPQITTAKSLQTAINEGLIVPINNNYKIPLFWTLKEEKSESILQDFSDQPIEILYEFSHDRIQQASYLLLLEKEKNQIHLNIGIFLLKKTPKDQLNEQIFNIVDHLNIGRKLITSQSQIKELAILNIQASKKAKQIASYEIALNLAKISSDLLLDDYWKTEYRLAFDIYFEILELFFLNTKLQEAEQLADILLKKSNNNFDRIKVYQIKILIYNANSEEEKSITIAAKALTELEINIELKKEKIAPAIQQEIKNINSFLKQKSFQSLIDLPEMIDPYKLEAMNILQKIMSSTIIRDFSLHIQAVLIQINLCIKYGNSSLASSPYSFYGSFLCNGIENIGLYKDIYLGNEFGNLAISLQDKFNLSHSQGIVTHMYYGFIWHWKNWIRNVSSHTDLIKSFQKNIQTGNYEFACFSAASFCFLRFFGGYPLEEMNTDFVKYVDVMNQLQQAHSESCITIFKKANQYLYHDENNLIFFVYGNNKYEESNYIESWKLNNWFLFFYYFSKAFIDYIFNNKSQSLQNSLEAQKYVHYLSSHISVPQYKFYASLIYCYTYKTCDSVQKKELLQFIDNYQIELKQLAQICSNNFQNKYDLVEAEKARVLGQNWQAEEFYEKAIQGAKKYEFIHEEALAYERASEFYFSLGREEIGKLYLKNAHHCYLRWGAKAKVRQLEEEYPQYLLGISKTNKSNKLSTTISTTGTDGEILDLATIFKASQAISSEIDLENLLQKLIKIVIENAGAQKGCLILKQEDHWVIEAQGIADRDEVTVLQSIPIDSVNIDNDIPVLPIAIINYIARTQESIVLNNAVSEGQFINDRYIIANQTKSILCTPLLNQGNLSGIVYLENNLTTDAFTPERIELLNILSAQAAISIDNSRLYQTLEQKVEERTKELSQTLEILKATQAELRFENDLLKSEESFSTFDYQVGGSLSMDAPTYVVRAGDRYLYQVLKRGEFCYVLNPRQVGKSSLMVRMIDYLQREGFCCAPIDMTRIGSKDITPEQWYKGLCFELLRRLGLRNNINFKYWWQERSDLSPVQKLSELLEDVILTEVGLENGVPTKPLVILIDEIDSVLNLDFSINDFFAFIRSCYNQRSLNPAYRRLTFALFGVTTPGDLMTDTQTTPFNIGQPIYLEGFKEHEAQPLLQGLAEKVSNPQTLLKEVLSWTNGQPFLTQKICKLIRDTSAPIPVNDEAAWLQNLIQTQVINNWEYQDEPEHLRTIRDRILKSQQSAQLLELYQQVLNQEKINPTSTPEERELQLSGLIIKQENYLTVNNRIYQLIFDKNWINEVKKS